MTKAASRGWRPAIGTGYRRDVTRALMGRLPHSAKNSVSSARPPRYSRHYSVADIVH